MKKKPITEGSTRGIVKGQVKRPVSTKPVKPISPPPPPKKKK